MNGITIFLSNVRMQVFYAQKAFLSIISGYDELECKDENGEFVPLDDLHEYPYWVCPVFYNGRHLPLPFFTDPENAEIGWLQLKAIQLARKLNPRSFDKAENECELYKLAWTNLDEPIEVPDQNDEESLLGEATLARLSAGQLS